MGTDIPSLLLLFIIMTISHFFILFAPTFTLLHIYVRFEGEIVIVFLWVGFGRVRFLCLVLHLGWNILVFMVRVQSATLLTIWRLGRLLNWGCCSLSYCIRLGFIITGVTRGRVLWNTTTSRLCFRRLYGLCEGMWGFLPCQVGVILLFVFLTLYKSIMNWSLAF